MGPTFTPRHTDDTNPSSSSGPVSFLGDSSSPECQSPSSLDPDASATTPDAANERLTPKAFPGLPKTPKANMLGRDPASRSALTDEVPRNSSIDSAISAVSSRSPSSSAQDFHASTADVANLIKKAGSAEALIQYLLKEKQSQSQQNNQLWRLVDKQRAMILGLNKDLERALKDKERYRKKFKDVATSNPAVSHASGSRLDSGKDSMAIRSDLERTRTLTVPTPTSPGVEFDRDSHKQSPIDPTMAPYPITPPADFVGGSAAAHGTVGSSPPVSSGLREETHLFPSERLVQYQTRSRPDNTVVPPPRSPPSDPPRIPPPMLPKVPDSAGAPRSPRLHDEALTEPPAPPPRKPPPVPLKLHKETRKISHEFPDDIEDSESDYDELLQVDEHQLEKRGRRRTREEDDRERTHFVASLTEDGRDLDPPANVAQNDASQHTAATNVQMASFSARNDVAPASLDTVLSNDVLPSYGTQDLTAPLRSPGLPASPRPAFHTGGAGDGAPLSPSTLRAFPPAPISPPLPPRQDAASPINTGDSDQPSDLSFTRPVAIPPRGPESLPPALLKNTSERTQVFTGLISEDYPDLLLGPNALPSISIKVASSRMKPSRASVLSLTQLDEDPVFTLAVIARSDQGELWRVEKDSSSFLKLDSRLKQCPTFVAKTPDRSLFIGHAPAKIDARRWALEQYLDELLNTPLDVTSAVELCKYLSTNTLVPNADEAGSLQHAIPANQQRHKAADGRSVRNGYLTKKGKNFGGWKARFFVLDGPQLKYYEAPGGAHLGTIKLYKAQIGKQSHGGDDSSSLNTVATNDEEMDNQYRHAFLVLEPRRKDATSHIKHVLCAENDQERDLWVEALVPWVSYRDDEPDDKPTIRAVMQPEQSNPSHIETSASSGKLRKAPGRTPQPPTADSQTLIGLRYDATNAGEAPLSGPPKIRSSGMPESASAHQLGQDTIQSPSSVVISGPKDPQLISDSAAWGNKTALPVPTVEEKKQRKRSFFGFGPKARSSSEGQDPASSDGRGATPPQGAHQGVTQHVFGAPLADAVRYCPPRDVKVPLPCVVYRCIQYLEEHNAALEEGIFRLSGSNLLIKQLRERFNVEGDLNLITDDMFFDVHAVGSLLKLYLRELPVTILTRDLHLDFLQTTEIIDKTEKLATMASLVQRLPQANATLLQYLIAFLIKIINNSDVNKMNIRNVGIVFSPTLNIPSPVFAMFLQHYQAIFGIEPEEYELPIADEGSSQDDGSMRFDPTVRPSTSSSNASPHAQPRLDSMRSTNSRSSPTPPLLANLNQARGSPTPPLGYARDMPEGRALDGSPQLRSSSHDRYMYQHRSDDRDSRSGQNDPSTGSGRRRDRESAVYVTSGAGWLPHQGSLSRLREESHY